MRITFTLLATTLLCTAVGVAQDRKQPPTGNQQPGGRQSGGQQGGPQFDAARFLKDHDANNDGKLTKDELPPRMQAGFADIDKDGDGHLTLQELQNHATMMENRRPEMVELVYWVIDVPEPETVSVQELQNAYGLLRKMDANNDGTIDPKEVSAFRMKRREERVMHTFEYLDKNKDKKISKDEARGLWADNFDQLDANHDGSLDEKEIDAAYNIKPDGKPGDDKKSSGK